MARITVHSPVLCLLRFPFDIPGKCSQSLPTFAYIRLADLSHPGINPHLMDLRYVLHAPSVYLSIRCIPTPEQLSELDPPLLVQGCLHPSKCVFYSTSGH